jgi:hypothetical protein
MFRSRECMLNVPPAQGGAVSSVAAAASYSFRLPPSAFGPACLVLALAPVVAGCAATPAAAGCSPAFVSAWGSAGTGDRQLHGPWGVGLYDPCHRYVAGTANDRVHGFSGSGQFLCSRGQVEAMCR